MMTAHKRHPHNANNNTSPCTKHLNTSPVNCIVSTVASSRNFSPSSNHHTTTKSLSPRMKRISKPFVMALDCFFVVVVLQLVVVYLFFLRGSNDENAAANYSNSHSLTTTGGLSVDVTVASNAEFQQNFPEALSPCDRDHQVTFSLAIPLREQELPLVKHHCKRWGIHDASISIAVYTTNLSPEEILEQLTTSKSPCQIDQLTITTLLPTTADDDHPYPIQKLVNLAIQAATTTHVIPLDIHMWSSTELYETLHTPNILHMLARDPQLMLVIPAFEVNMDACLDDKRPLNKKKCQRLVPRNYDDLIVHLGQKEVFPMYPEHYELLGSTQYREWITQPRGELLDIECISSNQFQPFVVVRKCQGLPPFQENMISDGNGTTLNDSTWIVHLLRLGYIMKQVGGEFLVYMSEDEEAAGAQEPVVAAERKLTIDGHDSKSLFSKTLFFATNSPRIRKRRPLKSQEEFFHWLKHSVPDKRVLPACAEA